MSSTSSRNVLHDSEQATNRFMKQRNHLSVNGLEVLYCYLIKHVSFDLTVTVLKPHQKKLRYNEI